MPSLRWSYLLVTYVSLCSGSALHPPPRARTSEVHQKLADLNRSALSHYHRNDHNTKVPTDVEVESYGAQELYSCSDNGKNYFVEPYFLDWQPKLDPRYWNLFDKLGYQLQVAPWQNFSDPENAENGPVKLSLSPDFMYTSEVRKQVVANCMFEFHDMVKRQGRFFEVVFHITDNNNDKLAYGSLMKDEEGLMTIQEFRRRKPRDIHNSSLADPPIVADADQTMADPPNTIFPIESDWGAKYRTRTAAQYSPTPFHLAPRSNIAALFSQMHLYLKGMARGPPIDVHQPEPLPLTLYGSIDQHLVLLNTWFIGWRISPSYWKRLESAAEDIVVKMNDTSSGEFYECSFIIWDISSAIPIRLAIGILKVISPGELPMTSSLARNETIAEITRRDTDAGLPSKNVTTPPPSDSIFPIYYDWRRPRDWYIKATEYPADARFVTPNSATEIVLLQFRQTLSQQIIAGTAHSKAGTMIDTVIGEQWVHMSVSWVDIDEGGLLARHRGLNCLTTIIDALRHEENGQALQECNWSCIDRYNGEERTLVAGRIDVLGAAEFEAVTNSTSRIGEV